MKASPSITYPRLLHTLLKALVGEKHNDITNYKNKLDHHTPNKKRK